MQTWGLLLRSKQKLYSLKTPINLLISALKCFCILAWLISMLQHRKQWLKTFLKTADLIMSKGEIDLLICNSKIHIFTAIQTQQLLWSVVLLLSTALRTLLQHIRAEVQLEGFWGGSESCACECGLWAWHDQGEPTDYFKKLWMYWLVSNSAQSFFRRILWVNYTVTDSLNPRRMFLEIIKASLSILVLGYGLLRVIVLSYIYHQQTEKGQSGPNVKTRYSILKDLFIKLRDYARLHEWHNI